MTNRKVRQRRIRNKIIGTAVRPRLSVYRSNKNIFLQAIDDNSGKTLASSSTIKKEDVAESIAKALQDKKITKIVFDRGGFRYHGKIKEVAEKLRSLGMEF